MIGRSFPQPPVQPEGGDCTSGSGLEDTRVTYIRISVGALPHHKS